MNTNRKPLSSRHLDMIAFLAVLATGTLLLLSGIPVSALVTLATALSGLYSAWNTKRIPPHPHDPGPSDRSDREDRTPAGTASR
ncbi:hypothetical protein [Streptomyces sp. NPDC058086]|uniref:hypothetical protein n=1 Tax=Streptomyces sp. NPDC058086 TaxID=3346334 RepID=UPI0036E13418